MAINVTALIPVKGFRNAKQRLSPLLARSERERLAETMFRDVLEAVVAAPGVSATVVVTGDDKVAAIAASKGAQVVREPAETGETAAVDFARTELKKAGHEAVLILPGDMPLVRSEDIEQVLAQAPAVTDAPFALLVPSHDHMGTNALLLAPPDIIELRFGYDSFNFHMSQLSACGLPLRFIENERIALDIDEPQDLKRLLSHPAGAGESSRLARSIVAEHEAQSVRRSGGT